MSDNSQTPVNAYQSSSETGHSESGATRRTWRRKLPPLSVRILLAGVFIAIVAMRMSNFVGDFAMSNVFTFLGLLFAGVILSVWFTFFSDYSIPLRASIWGLGIAAFVLAVFSLRVDHVSGELVPRFRFKWSKKPDEMLDPPVQAAAKTERQLVSTDTDFWQFLGPQRNARVDHVQLSRDWNASPPQRIWGPQPIGAGWSAFSAAGGYAVTLEQRGPEEFVTCYDIDSGKVLWAHGTRGRHQTVPGGVGPRSSPTIHNGRVYSLGATGELLCLEGKTGEVVWRDNMLSRFGVKEAEDEKGVAWGRAGSPLIVDDLVVVPAGGPAAGPHVSLVAFHKDTGSLAWQAGDDQISYASPVLATLAGIRQILSVNEKTVTGHDPATGKQLWQFSWLGNSTQDTNASQPVPVGQNRVFVSKGYGRGCAVFEIAGSSADALAANEVWSDRTALKTKFTNVVIYRDHVYGLSDGIFECLELSSGKRAWKKGRYGQGQILGVGDVILVQAESGEVAMVEATPDEYRELGRFAAIEGITWNNLCLQGKRLLVRNATEAACYELP
jgi:outer membrane protein assembly factor BamB